MMLSLDPDLVKIGEIIILAGIFIGVTRTRLAGIETSVNNMTKVLGDVAQNSAIQGQINKTNEDQIEKIHDRLDTQGVAIQNLEIDVAVVKTAIARGSNNATN